MNTIKYYWLSIQIAILKPFVKIEECYNRYKEWRLRMFVNQQILAECNYDIEVFKTLYSIKNDKQKQLTV